MPIRKKTNGEVFSHRCIPSEHHKQWEETSRGTRNCCSAAPHHCNQLQLHLQRHFTQRFLTLHTTMTTLALGSRCWRQEAAVSHDETVRREAGATWWTFALTVVSEQRLSRALALGAGGFRAAPAVEANATVGAAVAPCCTLAAVYAPLVPQQPHRLSACRLMWILPW